MAIVGEVDEIETNELFVVKFFHGMQNSVVFYAGRQEVFHAQFGHASADG
jgi:hypothetical protein